MTELNTVATKEINEILGKEERQSFLRRIGIIAVLVFTGYVILRKKRKV